MREVSSGRAQVVVRNPPSHQRSQKTVVRKALSPPSSSSFAQRAADSDDRDCRHMSHVTVFEDFMGKNGNDKDPLPPMPALPFAVNSNNAPALNHRLSRPFREEAAGGFEDVVEEEWENEAEGDIDPETMPVSPTGSYAQTWLQYERTGGAGISQSSSSSSSRKPAPLFAPRSGSAGSGQRNLTKPHQHGMTTTQNDNNNDSLNRYNACQSCRKRFHPSQAVSHNGTYFCRDCAGTSTPQREEERKKNAIDEEQHHRPKKASEQPAKQEGRKILYPYAATAYPPPRKNLSSSSRKPVPITLSGSTLQGSPSPPPSSSSTQQQRPRRRDIPPDYAHLYTPTFQPLTPSPIKNPTPTPIPARDPTTPCYTTPLPNGTYPRYRPPPPIPLPSLLPAPITTPTPTPRPVVRPASSIYPSTPGDLGRLSRVPSIPALPAEYADADEARHHCSNTSAVSSVKDANGKDGSGSGYGKDGNRYAAGRQGRSDTLASDTSFRAHVEGEVIDAYADMYADAGGRSPVSPISGFEGWEDEEEGWERGGDDDGGEWDDGVSVVEGKGEEWDDGVSVTGEYVGVGWR